MIRIKPKILLGIPADLEVDQQIKIPIERLTLGPQQRGNLCLFRVNGHMLVQGLSLPFDRELGGELRILESQDPYKLVPMKGKVPKYNSRREWYEFSLVFALVVGAIYTMKLLYSGETGDQDPQLEPAESEIFRWDLAQ
jgi:hypothetical protein